MVIFAYFSRKGREGRGEALLAERKGDINPPEVVLPGDKGLVLKLFEILVLMGIGGGLWPGL